MLRVYAAHFPQVKQPAAAAPQCGDGNVTTPPAFRYRRYIDRSACSK